MVSTARILFMFPLFGTFPGRGGPHILRFGPFFGRDGTRKIPSGPNDFNSFPEGPGPGPVRGPFATRGGLRASWLFEDQLKLFWRFLPAPEGA